MINKIYRFKNKKDLTILFIDNSDNFLSFILKKVKNIFDFVKAVFIIDESFLDKEEYKDFFKPFADEKRNKNISIEYLKICEKEKDFSYLENIFSIFLRNNIDRNSFIIIVGGGAFSDLIAFAASIYKRKVPFCIVPTTFLSMIDAGFGGKNAVNFMGVKNLLGTVNQPLAIFINPEFLKTLSFIDFFSGFAEFIKYLLLNRSLYNKFIVRFSKLSKSFNSSNHSKSINHKDFNLLYDTFSYDELKDFFIQNPEFLLYAINTKYHFIKDDIYDFNKRHSLNLGHTISHPLEITFQLNHGIALYIGIILELQIICKICRNTENTLKKANFLYEKFGLPKNIKDAIMIEKNITYEKWLLINGLDVKKVIEKIFFAISQDKKNKNNFYNIPIILNNNKIRIQKIPFEIFDNQLNLILNQMLS